MGKQDKLSSTDIQERHGQLQAWELDDDSKLMKNFSFKDFKEALEFTNQVGDIAERLNHHPDIHLTWGQVSLTIQTHEADALTDKDFELAQAIDQQLNSYD